MNSPDFLDLIKFSFPSILKIRVLTGFSARCFSMLALVAALLLAFLGASEVSAATYYWDRNDSTAGFGAAGGTWAAPTTNNSTQGWSTSSAGTDTLSGTTTTTTSDALNFGTESNGLAAGTITVSGNVTANSLTFGSASGNITLSGGNLTLGGTTPTITVNNANATISSFRQTAGLTKNGTGLLAVSLTTAATTNFTGQVTVNSGTLRVNNTLAQSNPNIITLSNATTIDNGSTLQFTKSGTEGRVKFSGGVTFGASGNNTLAMNTGAGTGGSALVQGSYTFTTLGGSTNYITSSNSAIFNMQSVADRYVIFNVADGADATDLQVGMAVTEGGIRKSGAGVLTMNASNTGINNLDITAGTLELAGAGSLNSGNFAFNLTNNGTLHYNGTSNQTLSGAISGTGALTKSNSSALTLSANNTYTGATLVTAGTLLVNGSLAAGSAVTVDSGATLGGSGTINGAAVVNGNLRPGNSPGVLTFGSSLTLGSTSAVTMELNGTVRGTGYDGIDVTGSLTYGGALTITVGSAFLGSTESFSLFTFGSQSGDLASMSLEGAYGSGTFVNASGVWSLTDSGGNQWSFSQATGNLGFTAVPEPSTWALLASSALVLLVVSRRRLVRKK